MSALPFNTERYDDLGVSVFFYEPLRRGNGQVRDFRIVYGNESFTRDWEARYHSDPVGKFMIRSRVLDKYTVEKLKAYVEEEPKPFSSYLPQSGMHVHFAPVPGLPEPYAGFFLTNITEDEERDARMHFLRNVRQMQNCAVLMRRPQPICRWISS